MDDGATSREGNDSRSDHIRDPDVIPAQNTREREREADAYATRRTLWIAALTFIVTQIPSWITAMEIPEWIKVSTEALRHWIFGPR